MTLTPEQLNQWQQDGFLKVAAFLNPTETEALQCWVEEIESWADSEDRWMHHREETPFGIRLSRSENFVPYHAGMRSLLTQGQVLDALALLMGESAVLYKEKINYKYPGGGGYAAHQDAPAYDEIKHHVTCLFSSDPATSQSGCLEFCASRHREGLIGLNDQGCIDREIADGMEWIAVETEPGDAVFFDSYAPHRSSVNQSTAPRRTLYVTYNARSEGDKRDAYYERKRQALIRYAAAGEGTGQSGRISTIGHFQGKTVH
ncbi:MAG: phytanoyl-CoA dioxygenase family protein [Verrucomicrobiae bacterium]|nr:phytanoyl-CoA dioxygenase family protein [Verrucomicrobiae bacterium]